MFKRYICTVAVGVMACGLVGCTKPADSVVDESIINYLGERESADMASVIAAMNGEKEPESEAPTLENETTKESESGEVIVIVDEPTAPDETGEESSETESETEETEQVYDDAYWVSVAESFADYLANGGEENEPLTPGEIRNIGPDSIPAIRKMFADVIVVGDSRAQSLVDCGVLTDNNAIYSWAAHVDDLMDLTKMAARLYRGKLLIIMGVNDMGYYMTDEAGFKRDYIALIDAYREINPDGEIYLQEIIPINPDFYYRWNNNFRMGRYNEIIMEIAQEKNCTFVRASVWAIPAYNADDGTGAHYNKTYHLYWAQAMANQMGLWED
ncbi:MAG: hypothetical protein K6F92_08670 [Lachnospiraceae bacterium]|nr:hypothetical protein [Lachnospiraceae bacterium]